MYKIRRRFAALGVVAAAVLTLPVSAQTYPSQPIKLVVPFAAGGATDIIGRVIGESLSRELGTPVVVENRAGANGAIGAEAVARSPADGHTLLVVTAGTHAINKSLYKKLPYDPVKDFTPVALVAYAPNIIVVHPSVPAKTVPELIDHMKKNPGRVNYGSAGTGSTLHLSGELFKSMAGVDIVHVPYKGGSAAQVDLLGGHIQVMFDSMSAAIQNVQSGKVRAIAVTGDERSKSFPDLPTVSESGLPGYVATAWFGVVGPAGMPADVTAKIHATINRFLASEEAHKRLNALGAEPVARTSEQFKAHIKSEVAKWAKVVEASGAKVD